MTKGIICGYWAARYAYYKDTLKVPLPCSRNGDDSRPVTRLQYAQEANSMNATEVSTFQILLFT